MANRKQREHIPMLARPTVHQALEYALGFTLASAAVRSPDRTVLALAGLLAVLNTATLRGPLAAWRAVGTQTHRVVDIMLAVVGVVVALAVDMGAVTRAEVLLAALSIAWLSVRFSHVVRETRS